jgi:hypothetical protein
MRIGIDFDNTIICYDDIFNRVGVEKKLIPEDLEQGKNSVRDYLRKTGREEEWTWLQGYVYGARLFDTSLYKGVKPFLAYCGRQKIECVIVSHKTRYPYSGERYDLHQSALEFVRENHLELDLFFEQTQEQKVQRINLLQCDWFIDDLPEFLQLPGFSQNICKILFDPLKKYQGPDTHFQITNSWEQLLNLLKAAR